MVFKEFPYPVSASATTGMSMELQILETLSFISEKLTKPMSGTPSRVAAVP